MYTFQNSQIKALISTMTEEMGRLGGNLEMSKDPHDNIVAPGSVGGIYIHSLFILWEFHEMMTL